jgi:hypothetical protein
MDGTDIFLCMFDKKQYHREQYPARTAIPVVRYREWFEY